jgi:Tol biopolymer transport system component
MNIWKTITSVFLLLALLGCRKDTSVPYGADELYAPYLTSVRDNGKVTLRWEKPGCLMCGVCFCPQLDPDYFEILISSTDPSELSVHSTGSSNIFEVTINNLANGTPYYFAVKAVGHKQFTISNTVMTIPDNPEIIQPLFQTIDKSVELGTWSPNQLSISYVSDYIWNNGNYSSQSVFIYSLSNNTEWLVEKSSRSPQWSPTGQKIVYHTDNGEVTTSQGYRPTHIAVYNIQDSTITRLTGGNSFNYQPTWSPDGNWIAFLSDKSGSKEYNLWKIPSDSGTAIQITTDFNDLNDLGIIADRSPKVLSWSKDGNSIAFARLTISNQGYNSDIYSVPTAGGSRTTILSSQWEDYAPAFSPDGTTLAFVSNRSGVNEIWTMDLQTRQLKQITGSSEKWVYTNPGNIEWSASGNKILFTSASNDFWTLYTVDIN